MKRILLAAAVFAALAVAPRAAFAQTATSTLTVTATVNASCTISAATLAFGVYDPLGVNAAANLDAQANVSVSCTKGSNYFLTLGLGGNAAGSTRRMVANGTDYLTYELYQNAGRTTVWGNTAGTAPAAVVAPSTGAITFTVFGRVPAGQAAATGAFVDSVQTTINF